MSTIYKTNPCSRIEKIKDLKELILCLKKVINDFSKVSPIRNKYFANSKPVSTLVEVNSLVKKCCKIKIEVIAIKEK